MEVKKEDMLLYVVTDRTWVGNNNFVQQIEEVIQAGATFLQLREKNLSYDEFVALGKEIKNITDTYKVPFIINDHVDVAVAVDADGVHIGQDDEELKAAREKLGPDKIIGVSTHNVEEALKAQKNGANYIGVGAVFSTSTKSDANTISFATVKEICNAVTIPVVAIGGITKDNLLQLSGSGVDGVAVISAIFAQPDLKSATNELLELSRKIVTT